MKKMKFFGKEVSAVMMGLLLFAGLGSAALVGYLSDEFNASAEVDSPLVVTMDKDDWSVYGGDSISSTVNIENLASNAVTTSVEFTIDSDYDWATGTEFLDEFTVFTLDGTNIKGDCSVDTTSTGDATVLVCDLGDATIPATNSVDFVVAVTFAQNIQPDTYRLIAQAMTA